MEEKSGRKDNRIAIIVVIAGLLTGGILTYVYLQPEEEPPRYSPEFRVAESQRVPLNPADDPQAEPVPESGETTQEPAEAPAQETGEEAAAESESAGSEATEPEAPPAESASGPAHAESTAAERKTIEETRERLDTRGVEDYVELTEKRYIRISAKMVIMAAVLGESSEEDVDPAEVQGMLADNAAEVLANERVAPEDFWSYTRDVHSDPERAKEMGEKILREAEKHTELKINFEDVPGLSPTPVKGADNG